MAAIAKITVSNAKQIDADNWVAIRESQGANSVPNSLPRGDCVVQASTSPRNNAAEWKQIKWSGGTPVPGQPNQCRVSRGAAGLNQLEASIDGGTKKVSLWVLWADIKMATDGPRPSGAKPWTEGALFSGPDKCGAFEIDSFSMGKNARGQVVAVAQLLPRGIGKLLVGKHASFKIRRQVTAHDFIDGKKHKHKKSFIEWAEDTLLGMQVLNPVTTDMLYDTDGPDLPVGMNTAETYNNFRQWVEWDGKPCSSYTYWSFQARWKDQQVTLKDVRAKTIELPGKAYYK
jgi:hypothetical protein